MSKTPHNTQLLGVALMAFLWTMSSLMVFSVLPIFLRDELGASFRQIGALEGIASFVAFFTKFLSGIISDIFRSRIGLLAVGSALTSLSKLLFASAAGITTVFAARFVDRLSKGIRAAPADAIIADLSTPEIRAQSYGMRQSLMTLGAVVGGLFASYLLSQNISARMIFGFSAIPAALSLIILFTMVREPAKTKPKSPEPVKKFKFSELFHMPMQYWYLLAIFNILMFARFSESFVIYRALHVGWSSGKIPFVLLVINIIHAACAYPAGMLADIVGKLRIATYGLGVLVIANLFIIFSDSVTTILPGIILIGVEMAMTHSMLKATASSLMPKNARGTGFSLLALSTGLTLSASNYAAGSLAHTYGEHAPFIMGCAAAGIGMLGFMGLMRTHKS